MSGAMLCEEPTNRLDESPERLATLARCGSAGRLYAVLSIKVRTVLHALADERESTADALMRRLSIDRDDLTLALLRLDAIGWLRCRVSYADRNARPSVHWRLTDAAARCVTEVVTKTPPNGIEPHRSPEAHAARIACLAATAALRLACQRPARYSGTERAAAGRCCSRHAGRPDGRALVRAPGSSPAPSIAGCSSPDVSLFWGLSQGG